MHLLNRLWRHFTSTSAAGRRAFPPATLHEIQATIARGERQHRAEIKVIIEASLDMWHVLGKLTARARAQELFSEYRVWDTNENTGVLIYINLADHRVEIIADRGIDPLLASTDWHGICAMMTNGFAQGVFHDGVIAALAELNQQLRQHAPKRNAADNEDSQDNEANQLSDTPLML